MRPAIRVLLVLFTWSGATGLSYTYPTSLNFIPTAATVGADTLLLETTNYGYSAIMATESTVGGLSEFGMGDRFEFGVDRYEAEDYSETYWNGKLRVFDEVAWSPAVAVGVMDVARASKPTIYVAASKAIGCANTHIGLLRSSYSHGVMAGVDTDIAQGLWLSLDYLPGAANHVRVGLSHKVGSDSWLQLTAGRPNDRSLGSTEIGLTFSTYVNLVGR